MLRSVLMTLLVSTFVACCWAQEDRERLRSVRSEFKKLEERAEKLPKPPKLNRRAVPTPKPELLWLIHDIHRFAAANGDLDVASAAHLLEAKVRLANGDPAQAVAAAHRTFSHQLAYAYQKVEALKFAALVKSAFGDFAGAEKDLALLLKDFPNDKAKEESQIRLELAKQKAKQQEKDVRRFALKSRNYTNAQRLQVLGQALRFAAAFPMAPFSETALKDAIHGQPKATPSQLCAPCERIAHYFPKSSLWPMAARTVVKVLTREGEYEKAIQHAQNLLDRSEVLKGNQAAQLSQLCQSIKGRLDRIYARPLDVEPKTKNKRIAHFIRFAQPYEDQEQIAQLAEDLRTDYPTMSEAPQISWILANAKATDSPEEALSIYQEIAEKHPRSQWGFAALEFASATMEKVKGPEDTEKWLSSVAANYVAEFEKTKIAVARADLLDQLDRWEEAKALLLPLKAKAMGDALDAISTRLAAYDKKLGQ